MATNATDTTLLARGAGRRAYRTAPTRQMWHAVTDVMTAHPELDGLIADVRSGWHAERAEAREGLDAGQIGGGL